MVEITVARGCTSDFSGDGRTRVSALGAIGFLAVAVSVLSLVPQTIRATRTRSTEGLSAGWVGLTRLRRSGIEASGRSSTPCRSIEPRLLREERFEGVVVSTLPRRLSRWLIRDLPHRIASGADVPVTHVEGHAGPSL